MEGEGGGVEELRTRKGSLERPSYRGTYRGTVAINAFVLPHIEDTRSSMKLM